MDKIRRFRLSLLSHPSRPSHPDFPGNLPHLAETRPVSTRCHLANLGYHPTRGNHRSLAILQDHDHPESKRNPPFILRENQHVPCSADFSLRSEVRFTMFTQQCKRYNYQENCLEFKNKFNFGGRCFSVKIGLKLILGDFVPNIFSVIVCVVNNDGWYWVIIIYCVNYTGYEGRGKKKFLKTEFT